MTKILKKCIYWLAICVVLENFMLFSVMGAPVQPSHLIFWIAILAALFGSELHVKKTNLAVALILFILPLVPLYRISDTMEFIKSYVIYALDIVFICFAVPEIIEVLSEPKVYDKFLRILIGVITLTELFGILQFGLNNAIGRDIAYGIFGHFESHVCLTSYKFGVYRAYSIFHEPSVFAWICSFGLAILLYKGKAVTENRKKLVFYYGINAVAMLTTLSTIGYVTYFLLLVCYFLLEKEINASKLFLLVGLFVGVYLAMKYTNAANVVSRITVELNAENSSGYERTVVPLEYLKRTLKYYPVFGRGLGQVGNVDKVGIIGLTSGVNNSLIGIFIDFGLSAIIPIAFFVKKMIMCLKYDRKFIIIVLNMLMVLFSTGAYMALSVIVVQVCSFLLYFDPIKKAINCRKEI